VEESVEVQQNEGLVDATVEVSATFSRKFTEEELDGQNGEVTHADHNDIDYLTLNEPLCGNKRSNVDETEEAFGFNKLDVMVISGDDSGGCAGSEKLHVITSEKFEVGANHIALSTVIALPSFGKCSSP
jgi:translation elongation factor EF-1beta